MGKPEWLKYECPVCHAKPQRACRDEEGFLGNPHPERQALVKQ